jgi:competence protein ComGF
MFLIDDLLLAPVSGFKFILGQIQKMADQELNDDTTIKEQLLELQMRLELEEISDEEFQEREAELFARLRALKMRQLDLLHQVHTAESSSFVIEVGGDEGPLGEVPLGGSRERE